MLDSKTEYVSNALKRDFKNLERAVRSETSDSYVLAMLNKLRHTIQETQRHLQKTADKK